MPFRNGEHFVGYEVFAVNTVARGFSESALAFAADIEVIGGAVRFTTDGTTVTAVIGSVLRPGEVLRLKDATEISNFSTIKNESANAKLSVTYYKKTTDLAAVDITVSDDLTVSDDASIEGRVVNSTVTTLDNTGTPTVAAGNVFKTGGTTAITDFDDGVVGQVIEILSAHTITITDGSAIDLAAAADYVMTATDTLILKMFNDQVWVEMGRSVNGG